MAATFHRTFLTVRQTSATDLHLEDGDGDGDDVFEFIRVEVGFWKVNEGFSDGPPPVAVEVGSGWMNVSLGEVVMGEEWPALILQDQLEYLGVRPDQHATLIADLMHYIEAEVIMGRYPPPVTVAMTIQEVTRQTPAGLEAGDQQPYAPALDNVEELTLLRQAYMAMDFDLDAAVRESMEVETVRTVPATEAVIAELDKVERGVENDLVCIICMDEEEDGMEFARMPCMHVFHDQCVGTWLRINASCPVCRAPLRG